MLRRLILFIARIGVPAIFLAGLHYYYLADLFQLAIYRQQILGFYGFIVAIHGISFSLFLLLYKRIPEQIGMAFFAMSFLKMLVCILYLWPVLKLPKSDASLLVVNFFAIYFIMLFIEVREVFILLRQSREASGKKA